MLGTLRLVCGPRVRQTWAAVEQSCRVYGSVTGEQLAGEERPQRRVVGVPALLKRFTDAFEEIGAPEPRLRSLERSLREASPQLSWTQAVAVLCDRKKRLDVRPDASLLQALERRLLEVAGEMNARGVASVFNVYGQFTGLSVTLQPSLALLQALERRALQVTGQFSAREVALLLNSAWKFPVWRPSDGLLAAMEQRWLQRLGEANGQELAMVLNAMSKFEHAASSAFGDMCEQRAMQLVDTFNTQDVSIVYNALGKLDDWQPSLTLLRLLEQRSLHCDQLFSPRHIASMLNSAVKLMGCWRPSRPWLDMLENQALILLRHFQPVELATVMHARSRLVHFAQPSTKFLHYVELRAAKRLAGFQPRELAIFVAACWRFPDWRPSTSFLSALQARLVDTADRCSVRDLANSLYAFSRIAGFRPSPDFVQVVERRLTVDIEALNSHDLRDVCCAVNVFDTWQPSTPFLRRFDAHAVRLVPTVSVAEVSLYMAIFAKFAHYKPSPAFIHVARQRFAEKIHTLESYSALTALSNLANFLRAHSHAQQLPADPIADAFERRLLTLDNTTPSFRQSVFNIAVKFPGWQPSPVFVSQFQSVPL